MIGCRNTHFAPKYYSNHRTNMQCCNDVCTAAISRQIDEVGGNTFVCPNIWACCACVLSEVQISSCSETGFERPVYTPIFKPVMPCDWSKDPFNSACTFVVPMQPQVQTVKPATAAAAALAAAVLLCCVRPKDRARQELSVMSFVK